LFINFLKKNFFIFIFIFIAILIYLYFAEINIKKNISNNISVVKRHYNGMSFFSHCTNVFEDDQCLKLLRQDKKKKILWIGNSQLDMINDQNENEITAGELLYLNLKNKNINFVTFSHPNISLKESYLLINYILSYTDVDLVILGICFDDFRENEIRSSFVKYIKDFKSLDNLQKSELGANISKEALSYEKQNNNFTSRIDNYIIDNFLSKINYQLFINNMQSLFRIYFYQIRNFIFNIKPETIRKTSENQYQDNIKYYFEIVNILEKKKIKLFNYIVPIRDDYSIPYQLDKYDIFKKTIKDYSIKHNIYYENFEKSILNQNYGNKKSTSIDRELEIDFMHYNFKGHIQMKNLLLNKIHKILNDF